MTHLNIHPCFILCFVSKSCWYLCSNLISFHFLGKREGIFFHFLIYLFLGRLEKESAEKGEKLNKIKVVAVKAKKELDASRKEVP